MTQKADKKEARCDRIEKVKKLVRKGVTSPTDISRKTGYNRGTVTRYLKIIKENQNVTNSFKGVRADILAREQLDNLRLQQMIKETWTLNTLSDLTETEKRGLFTALGLDFAQKYDKERLERGKSTANISYVDLDMNQFKLVRNDELKIIDVTPEKDSNALDNESNGKE